MWLFQGVVYTTQLHLTYDVLGKEGLFVLELNARMYTLRAKTDEEAETWVKTLLTLR